MISKFAKAMNVLGCFIKKPKESLIFLKRLPYFLRADKYVSGTVFTQTKSSSINEKGNNANPLLTYFNNNTTGPGIWKWEHYFDIYHKHFSKFIGTKVNVLEIGIYSGGSLGMWKSYFGEGCHVYGVDIENACKSYEGDGISVFIGDQEDPLFWKNFRENAPLIDIVIDDGGHMTEQQIITLQEILIHMNPGAVYLCEDINGRNNQFNSYCISLATQLSNFKRQAGDAHGYVSAVNTFQSHFESIHFYPFVTVLEKHNTEMKVLNAPKHGTEWQPFTV